MTVFVSVILAAIAKIQKERDEKERQEEQEKAGEGDSVNTKMRPQEEGGGSPDEKRKEREDRMKKREENRGDCFQEMNGDKENKAEVRMFCNNAP